MPKPSKRDQLVKATKELLWEVGYEAMSPRSIQERSAAKPGSLYHHFPSKLAIAEEALQASATEEVARLEEVFAPEKQPLEAIRDYLLFKRHAFQGCRLGRLVSEASIEHEELRQPVAFYFTAVRGHIERCLKQAQGEGTFKVSLDAAKLAVSLTALIQGGYVLARSFQDESFMSNTAEGALMLLNEATLVK